jgi:hypothetical protein
VTPSVSGKCSPAELIALAVLRPALSYEVVAGFEPAYTALQAVASPLGHTTRKSGQGEAPIRPSSRADDEIRTRDPHLGKVMLYH